MVTWIVNDLSINGQYPGVFDFLAVLGELLATRVRITNAGHDVSCSRELRFRTVTQSVSLAEAVHQIEDRALRHLALAWLMKGPFWASPPEGQGITYFLVEDVTNQGLGEAARRRWLGEDARTFSFNGMQQFEVPLLDVICLQDGEDAEKVVQVPNAWEVRVLTELLPVATVRPSWTFMIDRAVSELSYLQVARDRVVEEMSRYPYDLGASQRLFGLLKRLNELAKARAEHGDSSKAVMDWLRVNVMASRADFSSEEPNDPNVFVFSDPWSGGNVYCPWHGKVHNPLQYRIHYQWPMPLGQTRLKVLYIGEKLTKS